MAANLDKTLGITRSASSVWAALLCLIFNGCAAITNPIADGLPVRYLPEELLAKPKDEAHTIPLDLLGQPQPDVYRLGAGDVLGIYIQNLLGEEKLPIAVNVGLVQGQRQQPPTTGSAVPVREDGTVVLPVLGPVRVQGMTEDEAFDAIRKDIVQKKLLQGEYPRMLVKLMYPRQTHLVVLRQESGNITLGPEGGLAGGKRSVGHLIELRAYENDVLHALSQTGGMPGLDAYNEVVIYRNSFRTEQERAMLLEKFRSLPPGSKPDLAVGAGTQTIRIPLRRRPGESLCFGPKDVLLLSGDVVFVEARDQDVFYTAGLLPAGEHILPRDYDLDVIKAITRVRGPLVNGGFSTNNLSGNLIAPGLGGPSPSLLTVLRRTPDGGQVPIRVDLDRALRDSRERILIRPGDVLVLQEKPSEAVARYMTQTFFNFNVVWQAFRGNNVAGIVDIAAPDRLGSRALTISQP
jgi:protein involved in polysaccharide export with SLBB domain